MTNVHAATILERLHDQYLRGLDCDVILTAVDHLAATGSEESSVNANQNIVWKNLSCHKNVIRAASSFFDRIFSHKFTFQKLEVDEGIEGLLISNESDDRSVLKIILHKISSHSIQAALNFVYTGNVAIETNILRRAVEDFKIMNFRAIIDKLDSRVLEPLSFENCIPNLIICHISGKEDKYRETIGFLLEEFFRGFKCNRKETEEIWRNHVTTELPLSEMIQNLHCELQKRISEAEEQGLAEEKSRLQILLKLIERNCISVEEEIKLSSFLIAKRRQKCGIHFQNLQLYCYTDDQEICIQCLDDGHAKHLIKTVGAAKYERLAPYWEKIDLELETVKQSSKDRIFGLDQLIENVNTEKSRDVEILDRCLKLKPEMERLATIFESHRVEATDDVLELERFVGALEKESVRLKVDYEKAKSLSEKMMDVMQKRCTSCALIVNANLEIRTFEDFEEIDLDQPLRIENCISILKRSKNVNNQQMYDESFNFLTKNFIDVVKQSGDSFYRRISPSMFESLLKSDKLKVESEDDVIPIVKEWLEFDYRQRNKVAHQLLKQVRFGWVSEKSLKEINENPNHVIMMNPESRKLINDAMMGVWGGIPRDSTFVKVIAFGNNGLNATYDSLNDTWEEWQGQNNGQLFCAVIVAENVFIIGGRTNSVPQSNVSIYNLRTKTWKSGPNMLEPRYCLGACVSSSNSIYTMGGYNANHQTVNFVEVLQCDEIGQPIGEWKKLPPMNTPRFAFVAAAADEKIYAIGGHPDIATVEVFDAKENSWKYSRALTHGADRHTASVYEGEIYVFGKNGLCEKYNPETDTWTNLAALTTKVDIRGSAVLNNKIYLVGGDGCTEMDIYDVETNTWSKGPQMARQIGWTKCVSWL